jgi:hypothetical protein
MKLFFAIVIDFLLFYDPGSESILTPAPEELDLLLIRKID